jgi:hypothetical protein
LRGIDCERGRRITSFFFDRYNAEWLVEKKTATKAPSNHLGKYQLETSRLSQTSSPVWHSQQDQDDFQHLS